MSETTVTNGGLECSKFSLVFVIMHFIFPLGLIQYCLLFILPAISKYLFCEIDVQDGQDSFSEYCTAESPLSTLNSNKAI